MRTMEKTFTCSKCGVSKEIPITGGTGYTYYHDKPEEKICYKCIGEIELKELSEAKVGDKFTLYLVKRGLDWYVTNWPDSVDFKAHVRIGSHNIARVRYDAYFKVNGLQFHGVTYGDMTQICHVRRIKN